MSATLKDKLTIITFTHCWLYAPSTSLIESTLDSIYNNIKLDGVRHIINFDMKVYDDKSKQYLTNLNNLKEKYNKNIEIHTFNTVYDKRSIVYSKLMELVKTPYILMWEHDFVLEKKLDIEKIINTMDKYQNINFIRFNKRDNISIKEERKGQYQLGDYITYLYRPIDYWMETEKDITDIPLIKFCGYGGVPHIERVSWFFDYCNPLIQSKPAVKHNSIERAIHFDIYKKRDELGFEQTHKLLGTYIYGVLGESRYVHSLDEFKSKEAWGNKQPSNAWRQLNEQL